MKDENIAVVSGDKDSFIVNMTLYITKFKLTYTVIRSRKTHKFDDINNITVESLMFRPIIVQTELICTKQCKSFQNIQKSLYKNNNFINKNIQDFAQLIHEQPSLKKNEGCVSHDA